ncbi:hypothetical protein [Nonomuraea sp. CA-141351]|uniref:hypothetical protein n=1 Tax=Nonomuraea sp. CA-141351 TaxID=3239996 RepID=UPI003D941917
MRSAVGPDSAPWLPPPPVSALCGAKVVLATAASSDAMGATIDGLRHNGELIVLGARPESIQVSPFQLIARRAAPCMATRPAPPAMSRRPCASPR